MIKTPTQVFRYSLPFRLSLLFSAAVCLAMGGLALALPWTETFKPIEPSPDVTAILVSTLVFLPLAGYFLHRCNRFWGRLEIDGESVTIRMLTGIHHLPFERVASVSIAGSEGGHELLLLTEGRPREFEILTRHLMDEPRFMRIVRAGLDGLIQRQNRTWDKGEMTCEFSTRNQREGWYFIIVLNCMAWVVAGSVMWRHYDSPSIITIMIAGLVAVAGLTVMIHQRHYSRRFILTPQGLALYSVVGDRFVSYLNIRSIVFGHVQAHGARRIRCTINTPEGRWILSSPMRNFEGFVDRLLRRATQANIRGSLALDSTERSRVLRIRTLNTMRFWFAASLFVALLLIAWGAWGLNERWRVTKRPGIVLGAVTMKTMHLGNCLVRYEFSPQVEAKITPPTASGMATREKAVVYQGEARLPQADYDGMAVNGIIEVYYDPKDPDVNFCPRDIGQRFNYLFIGMGIVLFGYAGYQMRLLYLERRAARLARIET